MDESHDSLKKRVDEKFARPEFREAMEAVRAHEGISWASRAMGHMDGAEAKIDELHARIRRLEDALREVNSLQHQMAIELDPIPQQPRIEYWTRKMEDVIVEALGEGRIHEQR